MTPPIAFDPAASWKTREHLIGDTRERFVEVKLEILNDGRIWIAIEHPDENTEHLMLRPGFLDEFIAQARTREADAA